MSLEEEGKKRLWLRFSGPRTHVKSIDGFQQRQKMAGLLAEERASTLMRMSEYTARIAVELVDYTGRYRFIPAVGYASVPPLEDRRVTH